MLILSRRPGQEIRLGPDIAVSVVRIEGDRVVLGIVAPREVRVLRSELLDDVRDEIRAAADRRTDVRRLAGVQTAQGRSSGSPTTTGS